MIAWTVLYLRVPLIIAVVAPGFREALAPLLIIFSVSVVSIFWLWRTSDKDQKGMPEQSNPTELKTALVFGLLYAAVLLASSYAKHYFGNEGLRIVAVLSGLTDVDPITLSTANLVQAGKLLAGEGWYLVVAAVTANIFFKGVLAALLGGKTLFKTIFLSWSATLVTGLILLRFW